MWQCDRIQKFRIKDESQLLMHSLQVHKSAKATLKVSFNWTLKLPPECTGILKMGFSRGVIAVTKSKTHSSSGKIPMIFWSAKLPHPPLEKKMVSKGGSILNRLKNTSTTPKQYEQYYKVSRMKLRTQP